MKRLLLSFSLTLILGLWAGWPSPSAAAVPDGKVTVHPSTGIAGHFGTWTLTYRIGRDGIRRGGPHGSPPPRKVPSAGALAAARPGAAAKL